MTILPKQRIPLSNRTTRTRNAAPGQQSVAKARVARRATSRSRIRCSSSRRRSMRVESGATAGAGCLRPVKTFAPVSGRVLDRPARSRRVRGVSMFLSPWGYQVRMVATFSVGNARTGIEGRPWRNKIRTALAVAGRERGPTVGLRLRLGSRSRQPVVHARKRDEADKETVFRPKRAGSLLI